MLVAEGGSLNSGLAHRIRAGQHHRLLRRSHGEVEHHRRHGVGVGPVFIDCKTQEYTGQEIILNGPGGKVRVGHRAAVTHLKRLRYLRHAGLVVGVAVFGGVEPDLNFGGNQLHHGLVAIRVGGFKVGGHLAAHHFLFDFRRPFFRAHLAALAGIVERHHFGYHLVLQGLGGAAFELIHDAPAHFAPLVGLAGFAHRAILAENRCAERAAPALAH